MAPKAPQMCHAHPAHVGSVRRLVSYRMSTTLPGSSRVNGFIREREDHVVFHSGVPTLVVVLWLLSPRFIGNCHGQEYDILLHKVAHHPQQPKFIDFI
ncbi:hypothetical protein VTO42DRAFT_8678 [Malbranchea cinnamomea]